MKLTLAVILLIPAALAAFVAMSILSEYNANKADTAVRLYENCVYSQYGKSPATYYQEHGAYPTCK